MENRANCASPAPLLGRIRGFLTVALLAALGASGAPLAALGANCPQVPVPGGASSPNSILAEISPEGKVVKVCKPDGTLLAPIPGWTPNASTQALPESNCVYCFPGDGCYKRC
jgi:hypothetical protein